MDDFNVIFILIGRHIPVVLGGVRVLGAVERFAGSVDDSRDVIDCFIEDSAVRCNAHNMKVADREFAFQACHKE